MELYSANSTFYYFALYNLDCKQTLQCLYSETNDIFIRLFNNTLK